MPPSYLSHISVIKQPLEQFRDGFDEGLSILSPHRVFLGQILDQSVKENVQSENVFSCVSLARLYNINFNYEYTMVG